MGGKPALIGEFAQVMLDRLSTYEPFSDIKDRYYGDDPIPARIKYPYILARFLDSDEEHQTSVTPTIRARYLLRILDRTTWTSTAIEAAQEMERRVTHYGDVAKELLKADGTIRDLIGADGDFKAVSAEFTPTKDDDYATAQQDIIFEAVFHSNAGVWGYSYWGWFVWG